MNNESSLRYNPKIGLAGGKKGGDPEAPKSRDWSCVRDHQERNQMTILKKAISA